MSIRRRTVTNSQPCFVEAQQLESKQLLTGVVTLAITGANISAVGDSSANELDIQIGAANITVAGLNGTVLKNANGVVIPNGTAFPKPANGNLSVNLKGGDDVITVNATGAFTANNVTVDTGSGNDKVSVLRAAGGSYDIKGSVSLDTGSGDDDVAVTDVVKQAGAQTAAAFIAIANDTAATGNQTINVAKNLKISTGNGNDSVGLLGVEVKGNLKIHSGFGHGDNVGVSNVRVGGNMDLIYGDTNAISNVTVVGKLEADSGTGDDTFALYNVKAGQIDINLGSGRDQIALSGVTSVSKGKIRGGSGTDQIVGSVGMAGAKVTMFQGNAVDPAIVDNVLAELVASGIL
jgi:hypothetical protein